MVSLIQLANGPQGLCVPLSQFWHWFAVASTGGGGLCLRVEASDGRLEPRYWPFTTKTGLKQQRFRLNHTLDLVHRHVILLILAMLAESVTEL